MNYCKQLFLYNFANTWKTDIQKKPKLQTYCVNITVKGILLKNMSHQIYCQMSDVFWHNFKHGQIEVGRYAQIKLEERVCKICTSASVEDEFHFILHCDAYLEVRNTLVQNCNQNRTNTDKDTVEYLFGQYPRKFSKFFFRKDTLT